MGFTLVFHHKGKLLRSPKLHYEEGEVHVFKILDVDTWSYFEAIELLKDLGYNNPMKLWWEYKDGRGKTQWKDIKEMMMQLKFLLPKEEENVTGDGVKLTGLGRLDGVSEVREMVDTRGKGVVEDVTVQKGNVNGDDADGEGSDSSDESVNNIHFEDSEEEGDLGLGHGFSDFDEHVAENVVDEAGAGNVVDEVEPSRKNQQCKKKRSNGRVKRINVRNVVVDDGIRGGDVRMKETFIPDNVERMHNMEEECFSEELGSCEESDCDMGMTGQGIQNIGRKICASSSKSNLAWSSLV
ncbi:hypothetical protein SESBI_27345 [Sesbania bispinosa]|nr:hypothetical protein SESBI_27345 [Sesbania bispinosa]